MRKRLVSVAMAGAALPALLVGGSAGSAVAAPQSSATHHAVTARDRAQDTRCRLVPVKRKIRYPDGHVVTTTTSRYVCVHDGGHHHHGED